MDFYKKLNKECCFSCLVAFEGKRAAIKIDENEEVLEQILCVGIWAAGYVDTMNLCFSCYAQYKDAKEEFLKLKNSASFKAKSQKWAFTIVRSIIDDDYLGTSPFHPFLNLRAKIFGQWINSFKNHQALNQSKSDIMGMTSISQVVVAGNNRNVKSMPVRPTIPSSIRVASTIPAEKQSPSKSTRILVRKDPSIGKYSAMNYTGADYALPATLPSLNIQNKLNTSLLAKSSRNNNHAVELPYSTIQQTKGKILKSKDVAPRQVPFSSADPIVDQTEKSVTSPAKSPWDWDINVAAVIEMVPNSANAIVATPFTEETESVDTCQLTRPNRKTVKRKSTSTKPKKSSSSDEFITKTGRRICKNTNDTSCFYGEEYDLALKYSSTWAKPVSTKAKKQSTKPSQPKSAGQTKE